MTDGATAPPGGDAGDARDDLLVVGHIDRPHGLRGDVVVTLLTDRTERLHPDTELRTATGVLRVATSRPFGKRWIVRFCDVDHRDTAAPLAGTDLLAPPLHDPDALWVHDLVGSVVLDQRGDELGRVASVVANPASDLLELESGGLIPLRFVLRAGAGRIVVDIPDGLLD